MRFAYPLLVYIACSGDKQMHFCILKRASFVAEWFSTVGYSVECIRTICALLYRREK